MPTFQGLEALAQHFERVIAGLPHATTDALTHVGTHIQEVAAGKLGSYQAAAGPFAAWVELAEFTKQDRKRKGYTENDPLKRTGALANAITNYVAEREVHIGVPNATVGAGTKADPIRNIGDVAEAMEFGTNRIPPRSFLGSSLFEEQTRCQLMVTMRYERLITTGA